MLSTVPISILILKLMKLYKVKLTVELNIAATLFHNISLHCMFYDKLMNI